MEPPNAVLMHPESHPTGLQSIAEIEVQIAKTLAVVCFAQSIPISTENALVTRTHCSIPSLSLMPC